DVHARRERIVGDVQRQGSLREPSARQYQSKQTRCTS
ncbi:MAG: hypothetical protein QOG73_1634, partial [Acetobacteraceae bacterium]|nr:hypothetical protein [Acetobacteraceae bacterium]